MGKNLGEKKLLHALPVVRLCLRQKLLTTARDRLLGRLGLHLKASAELRGAAEGTKVI